MIFVKWGGVRAKEMSCELIMKYIAKLLHKCYNKIGYFYLKHFDITKFVKPLRGIFYEKYGAFYL